MRKKNRKQKRKDCKSKKKEEEKKGKDKGKRIELKKISLKYKIYTLMCIRVVIS
jgi:hypothetical protein